LKEMVQFFSKRLFYLKVFFARCSRNAFYDFFPTSVGARFFGARWGRSQAAAISPRPARQFERCGTLVGPEGLEPSTDGLRVRCSTN
jgi:hypothetical protein